jgi:hypothetical protein
MAQLDSDIYFQLKTPKFAESIASGVEQGMKLRDMVDARALKQKELLKRQSVEDAYTKNTMTSPDGSVSYNQKGVLADLAKTNPEAYQQAQEKFRANEAGQMEGAIKKLNFISQHLGAAQDQASYTSAVGNLTKAGFDTSEFPPQYDPNVVKSHLYQSMTGQEQLAQRLKEEQEKRAAEEFKSGQGMKREQMAHEAAMEAARHGRVVESQGRQFAHEKEMQGIRGQQGMDQMQARYRAIAEGAKNKKAEKSADMTVAEAKQRGLYEMGVKAEQQYLKAIADKNDYDPTAIGQVIDNGQWAPNWMKNDKAIEAQSAQAAWVEAFLRDASGAAIPPSERLYYAKDFFPQPGDTQQVIENKAALRAQKAQNARLASGLGPQDGDQQKTADKYDGMSDEELSALFDQRIKGTKNANSR